MNRFTLVLVSFGCLSVGVAGFTLSNVISKSAEQEFRQSYLKAHGKPPTEEVVEAAMKQLRRQFKEMPTQLGRQIAEANKRNELIREASKGYDATAFLMEIVQGGSIQTPDGDFQKHHFAKYLPSYTPTSTFDGGLVTGRPVINDELGAIKPLTEIEFPQGSFQVDSRSLTMPFRHGYPFDFFPENVFISGAGKNKTVLTMDELRFDSPIRNLTIRDVSILTNRNGLFRLIGGTSIQMQNVRVITFDAAHVFEGFGAMIRAQNCEFIESFVNRRRDANLFQVDPLFCHLQDCTIVGFKDGVFPTRLQNSRVWVENCDLDHPLQKAEDVKYISCDFTGRSTRAVINQAVRAISSNGPFDPTRPTSGQFTLTARNSIEYGTSAFSFRHSTQNYIDHLNYVDLVFQDGFLFVISHGGISSAIADVGPVSLESIREMPLNLSDKHFTPTKGHSYVQRVACDGRMCFVKFTIVDMSDSGLEIKWAMLHEGDLIPNFSIENRGAAGQMGFNPNGGSGGDGTAGGDVHKR